MTDQEAIRGQISIFEMLGETNTPLIPFEEQKKGRKGWVIEISAILLRKNGFKDDRICVCTRPIVFTEDSRKDKYGRISQFAQTTHGDLHGWYGPNYTIYAKRPTYKECVEYARKKYTIPDKVSYYERDGKGNEIWNYEDGYQKGSR